MGDPRKTRKQFKRPLQIWNKANIEKEKNLKEGYGLKNKREIWRAEAMLRKKRQSARSMLALALDERLKREKELLQSLVKLGILDDKATLDDVLTLSVESFLERRLQTVAWRKGLANTATQARQFITHGHIAIAGRRVTAPSYLVTAEEEKKIGYYAGKKMALQPAVKEKKSAKKQGKETQKEKSVREKFEEAKPAEEKKTAAREDKQVEKTSKEEQPKKNAPKQPAKEEKAKKKKEAT